MDTDIRQTTTTQLKAGVPDYKVSPKIIDEPGLQPETNWDNPFWTQYLGYLKTIPEYRNAVRALAIWTCGKGWTADSARTKVILEHITGWGEDSFDSIMQDMIIVKKTNGDSYAEIIRDDKSGMLINLKKLNPSNIRIVISQKGMIIRYEEIDTEKTEVKHKFKPEEIFHLCNDRIANEIHGTSVLESCKWIIDWKNEMMSDLRRVMHRSTIRVLYVDENDPAKLRTYREQYKEAIKNGEVLIMPGKPQDASFQELNIPPTQAWMEVIRYADNYFYEVLGVPKITTGGTQDYTEASSKIGYLTFEQPYMTEQRLLEQDIWNQLGIKLTFNRPTSLKDNVQSDEAANTGQVGFQPSETQPTIQRNE